MRIRKAALKNLKEFVELKKQDLKEYSKLIGKNMNFSEASVKKEFMRILFSRDECLFIAEEGEIIGFVHGKIEKKSSKAKIEYIFVEKNFRNKRIAAKLVKEFLKVAERGKARNISLNVHPKNKRAVRLFNNLGFRLSMYKLNKEI